MIEMINEVSFFYILGKTFHHVHCNANRNIESLCVEVNLRKRKWFLNCSCNPYRNSILRHLEYLNRVKDEHSKTYDTFIFTGDFNVDIEENNNLSIILICR